MAWPLHLPQVYQEPWIMCGQQGGRRDHKLLSCKQVTVLEGGSLGWASRSWGSGLVPAATRVFLGHHRSSNHCPTLTPPPHLCPAGGAWASLPASTLLSGCRRLLRSVQHLQLLGGQPWPPVPGAASLSCPRSQPPQHPPFQPWCSSPNQACHSTALPSNFLCAQSPLR